MREGRRRDTGGSRNKPNRAHTSTASSGRGLAGTGQAASSTPARDAPGNPSEKGCSVPGGDNLPETQNVSSRAARLAQSLIPYSGSYLMRGRWLAPEYTGLRNAAWAVRNARVANDLNPLALKLVVAEAGALLRAGEELADVLEAVCELLLRP